MFPIAEARFLAPEVKLFRIAAPRIARKRQAGQFVIVRLHDDGERIPLTIAGSAADGTITLIVQGIGKTTKLMNRLLQQRNAMYRDAEAESLRAFLEDPEKELGRVRESCQLHEVSA